MERRSDEEIARAFEHGIDRIQHRYGWSTEYVIGRRLAEGGDGLSYAELLDKVRVVGEALKEEKKERAFWNWRANPPMEGDGKHRRAVGFDRFLGMIGLGEPVELVMPDMEKIERIRAHHQRGEVA